MRPIICGVGVGNFFIEAPRIMFAETERSPYVYGISERLRNVVRVPFPGSFSLTQTLGFQRIRDIGYVHKLAKTLQ